ncbi:MAG: acyl carrier protein [Desulforhopalus sp.]|jgi:acyl carrier protein
MLQTIKTIREFIVENFLYDTDNVELQNDDSFLDLGIIDSTGILELIDWLEEVCGLEVDDDELIPENLDSINNLAKFISKKQTQ